MPREIQRYSSMGRYIEDATDGYFVKYTDYAARVAELEKLLEDANRGAERNAHINTSLASKFAELEAALEEAKRATVQAIRCGGLVFASHVEIRAMSPNWTHVDESPELAAHMRARLT